MKRYRVPVALLGLALTSSVLLAVAAGSQVSHGPVYSVAEVQAGLVVQPQAWVGRIVRVQGSATVCETRFEHGYFRCTSEQPRLSDAGGAAAEPLLLVWEAPAPVWSALWRLPLLRGLLPAVQPVQWGVVATYRVQLRAAHASSCASPPCYQAVLLDAAP
jgi:hypothetical protein